MDERGNIVKSGVWKNGVNANRIVRTVDELIANPGEIEELNIANNSFNEETEHGLEFLEVFSSLKRIVIGKDCFMYVRDFKIVGLPELESIVIGEICFTDSTCKTDISKQDSTNNSFCIENCSKLKSIHIGEYSFSLYCVFELKGLPLLETIDMGGY